MIAAAGIYRLFLFLSVIGAAAMAISMLMAYTTSPRPPRGGDVVGMLAFLAMMGGLSVLYGFAFRGTMRSQRWAPMTMFVLFMLGVAANVLSFVLALGADRVRAELLIAPTFGIVLGAIFGVVSWRSYASMPAFLAQPAWAQELILTAGL